MDHYQRSMLQSLASLAQMMVQIVTILDTFLEKKGRGE